MNQNPEKIKNFIKKNKILYRCFYPMVNLYRRITGIYIRTSIFYVKRFLLSHNIIKKSHIWEQLKNAHKGQRIFIVSTGPSLKISDLEWLRDSNALTISCNGIFKLFNKTSWRPDYYIMDDYYLYDDYKKKNINLIFENMSVKKVLLSDPIKKRIEYAFDNSKIGFFPICYFDHWFTHKSKIFRYNKDISLGHFDLYTVTNAAINLAHYMGAKEIILLGADCNYSQGIVHSGEIKAGKIDYRAAKEMEDAQKSGYNQIAKAFQNSDSVIINATRGGSLEMFQRKSMDKIIETTKNISPKNYKF